MNIAKRKSLSGLFRTLEFIEQKKNSIVLLGGIVGGRWAHSCPLLKTFLLAELRRGKDQLLNDMISSAKVDSLITVR